jgi:hypothetical protein
MNNLIPMKFKPAGKRKFVFVLILSAAVWPAGCGLFSSNDSVHIEWVDENLSDYVVITYNKQRNFEKFGVIDPVTGDVLDTFDGFAGEDFITDIVPTPDGRHLYVSISPNLLRVTEGTVYKVDVLTWEMQEVYHEATFLKRGHDHELYFVTAPDSTGKDRTFGRIDPATDNFIELTTIDIAFPVQASLAFDVDYNRSLVYYIDEQNRLNRKNYETGEHSYILEEYGGFWRPGYIHISYSGDYLFFPGGPVINLRTEKIIGSVSSDNQGRIVSRRDEKEVYFSDPGRLWSLTNDHFTGKITVYSTQHNGETGSFYLFHESGQPVRSIEAHLTFNDRYLVVGGRGCGFVTVDLKTRDYLNLHCYRDIDLYPFYLFLTRRVH